MMDFDRRKSIQELEGANWGEPPYPSYLVTTIYALRHKPLKDFSIEDLRIMIGQNISLPFLVPLALEVLGKNLLAEGDYYPGDLLNMVVAADPNFWLEHPDLKSASEALL